MNPTDGVIREAWGLYKTHWRHLLPISFVVYVTIAVVGALLAALLSWFGALIGALISLVGLFWVQGALTTAVEDIRDGRADLALGETFERVRPQLGAIAVGGLLAALGIFVGLVLLIVPGLVLLTWWVLVIPVIVLERVRAGEAFGRSRELVRGHGWNVFGTIVIGIGIGIAASIVTSLALIWLPDALENFLSSLISNTVIGPFIAAAWTLMYFHLRGEPETTPAPQPTLSGPTPGT
jgi:hypothetical protein